MRQSVYLLALACLVAACPMPPPAPPPAPRGYVAGETFDSVVTVLRRRYYDTTFVATALKSLVEEIPPGGYRRR